MRNIGSNLKAVEKLIHLRAATSLLGVLPLFHSFGYTATLWTVLAFDPLGVYHYTPLEPRQIGALPQASRHDPDRPAHVPAGLSSPLRAGRPSLA